MAFSLSPRFQSEQITMRNKTTIITYASVRRDTDESNTKSPNGHRSKNNTSKKNYLKKRAVKTFEEGTGSHGRETE